MQRRAFGGLLRIRLSTAQVIRALSQRRTRGDLARRIASGHRIYIRRELLIYEVTTNDERARRATGARGRRGDRSLTFAGRRPRGSPAPARGAELRHPHPTRPVDRTRALRAESHPTGPHTRRGSTDMRQHTVTTDSRDSSLDVRDGHNEVRNSITTPHNKPRRRWSMHRKARDYEHEQRAGRSTRARAHHSLQGSITSHNADRSDQAPFRHTFRLRTRSRDVHFPT